MTSTSPKYFTGRHVRDGFNDVDVGAAIPEDVRGIAGGAKTEHVERGALIVDERLQAREQLLGVRDRIAFRQLIGLAQHGAVFADEHRLRRSGAAVEADDRAHLLARRKRRGRESWNRVRGPKRLERVGISGKRWPGSLAELRLAATGDEGLQRIEAAVQSDAFRFVQAVHHGAVGGVVLRVGRDDDQFFERHVSRTLESARLPCFGDPLAPALLKEREERVRPSEEQHLRTQRVPAREHRQVLHHDGVGERAHDLGSGNPGLHEVPSPGDTRKTSPDS
jgi:hypothetical protein